MPSPDPLSLVFSALADPTRRAILVRLGEGEATVNELAEPFSISLPAISRHLKVLEHAGLIERSRRAQWRTNTLRAEGLVGATGWIEELTRVWGERFDRLDAHLAFLKGQLAQAGDASGVERSQPGGVASPEQGDVVSPESGGLASPDQGDIASPTQGGLAPPNQQGGAAAPRVDGELPSGEESA